MTYCEAFTSVQMNNLPDEPRREKTSLRGFQPGSTQPGCTAPEDG